MDPAAVTTTANFQRALGRKLSYEARLRSAPKNVCPTWLDLRMVQKGKLTKGFGSADFAINLNDTVKLLGHHEVMVGDFDPTRGGELLR